MGIFSEIIDYGGCVSPLWEVKYEDEFGTVETRLFSHDAQEDAVKLFSLAARKYGLDLVSFNKVYIYSSMKFKE